MRQIILLHNADTGFDLYDSRRRISLPRIGGTCFTLMLCHLQPYAVSLVGDRARGNAEDPRQLPIRPSYVQYHNLRDPKHAAKWWELRKNKPLRDPGL